MTLGKIRNFGVVAHIDAGKTTTTERVLYYSKRIHRVGNVDEGTTTTDWYHLEQEKGVTIFSAAVTCEWRGHMLNLIDTPGHIDFTAEVERSLRVLDGAVVVFDGVHGVEAQSETVWRQAARYHVPRLVYINKMDRPGADFEHALETLRRKLQARPVPVTIPWGAGKDFRGVIDLLRMRALTFEGKQGEKVCVHPVPGELGDMAAVLREELLDVASEYSDALLEKVVEGEDPTPEEILKALREGTRRNEIQPTFAGSSLHCQGVQPVLDGVVDLLPSPSDVPIVEGVEPKSEKPVRLDLNKDDTLCAFAFKTATDRHGETTYIRVYTGTLSARAACYNPRLDKTERINQMFRIFSNDRTERISEAGPGEIVVVTGLKLTTTGDTLCDRRRSISLESMTFAEPVVTVSVEPRSSADRDRLEEVLQRLSKDDPTFRTTQDDETGQTLIHAMGELHAEILLHRITEDFKVPARTGEPRVAFKETVTAPAKGEDRHEFRAGERTLFGHVEVTVTPQREELAPRVRAAFPPEREKELRRFEPAILEGLRSAVQSGEVAGYPMVYLDVVATNAVVTPESAEAAYSAAAVNAFRKAVQSAASAVLEPHMRFEVTVPEEFVGDVLNDLNRRGAEIREMSGEGGWQILEGNVPLSKMFGYATSIRSLTQGRGSYTMEPQDYRAVPEPELKKMLGGFLG